MVRNKKRTFKKAERVVVMVSPTKGGFHFAHVLNTLPIDRAEVIFDDESCKTHIVKQQNVYKINEKLTKLNQDKGTICYEHNKDLLYPYFCPEQDENYYNCELKQSTNN